MNIATLTLNPALDRSMLFKSFQAGRLNRAYSSVTTVGGKGINVARALKKFGYDAVCYGLCGGDSGEMMKKMLDKEGIKYDFVATRAPTRMNIKIADADGVDTEASEAGGPVSKYECDVLVNRLYSLFESSQRPDIFIISGSAPIGIPPSLYKEITLKAKENGIKVILDCDRDALRQGITAQPFMIKPNRAELEEYARHNFQNENEAVCYACDLSVKTGIKILLTLGADGAVYIDPDGAYKVNAPKVTMRGFTGAGDSFLAAFCASYLEKPDPCECLKAASAFSAAKVELEGTMVPEKDSIQKYINEIKANRLR